MGILSWIVLGGLAGWVASIIMKKNATMGAFANIVVGIIGAFIGGFLMNYLGGWDITGFNLKSFLVALLGSVVLLAIINLIKRGRVR
jgi:uncharacterized membrane protein YeaQ/YmgE (transglycosylase-associated protein family)